MTSVIPPRFLFRWAWPVPRRDSLPAPSGQLLGLPDDCRMFPLSEFDDGPRFADLKLAWNDDGFGLSVEVRGKQDPVQCLPASPASSDGVTVWIDTRSTQTVHRATRYCHQFCILPSGGGAKKAQPSVTNLNLGRGVPERAAESSAKGEQPIRLWSELRDDGYLLEVWFSAASLQGFDPETHRQLGFYLVIRDAELGEQYLSVGREFPFEHDPSLWQLLDLSPA